MASTTSSMITRVAHAGSLGDAEIYSDLTAHLELTQVESSYHVTLVVDRIWSYYRNRGGGFPCELFWQEHAGDNGFMPLQLQVNNLGFNDIYYWWGGYYPNHGTWYTSQALGNSGDTGGGNAGREATNLRWDLGIYQGGSQVTAHLTTRVNAEFAESSIDITLPIPNYRPGANQLSDWKTHNRASGVASIRKFGQWQSMETRRGHQESGYGPQIRLGNTWLNQEETGDY